MADTYLNQKGAQHRAEKTKEWADARFVRYATYNAVGVAGSGKNVSVLFPQTLYVPDGLIMGGTALSAGLATRGICGVTTPDGKGGCTKENLYLNYDGNNNYSRKVVLGAGSAGNEIANSSGAYTYSAVRGDQMVSYVTNYVPGAIETWFDSNVHIPSIKTLNTNNSSTLPVSSSEARSGSGSINLHKVSKTGKFSDLNNRGEAFLSWGGQNLAGSYGPIDSAMIADLGANRLAFMPPAGISVEYSRDSGTTWQNYGATDGQKLALTSTGVGFSIGKADSSNKATEKYMLRISLHTSEGKVYTQLNKFALYVSTNGSNGSYCTIRARTQNNYLNKVEKWDVFANKQSIAGWSGWNIINTSTITTYGNSPANQYGEIQLIFGCTSGSTKYAGLQIQRLMGFGGVGWTTPSNMAKYGTIYSYDYNQGVVFPGALTASGTFTSSASTILSSVKSAGILGTDSSGKVYDNSKAYQKAGDYATKSDLTKYQPAGNYQPKGDYATKSDLGKYQPKGDYVTYDNASKDIYLGSHGIHSGTRPSSGSATLMGNGYWIQESSVGVSSAVSGGVAVSSEMTPGYISVSNGKIKMNSSGIVSDAGTFKFDGNPGSVATSADLRNYQKKGNYVTIDTAQTISAKKTFSATPTLSAIKNKKVIGTDANGLIEAHTLGIDDITDLRSQLNGKQPSGAYAERQSAQTITGNWTFTGATNFNGTTKVNGNEIASKGYVDGIFDSKLDASEATNFAKFTKFDSDTLKMTGARLYRTSAGDTVDRSSMYGYSSQNTYGTTYTRFAGMATIGSSQVFIGFYQYTKADGSNGEYIGNVTLSNGRLARVNGSLSSVNELTDAYAVLSDLNNKANKTHTHAISDVTNLQTSLDGKASKSDVDSMNSQITFLEKYTKVYYVDTNITTSDAHGIPINSKFENNAEMISSDMSTNFNTYPTNQCIYADRIGDVTPNELKVGDIIVIDGYLSRYVSDKTTVSTSSGGQASVIRVKFTAINKQYLDRINSKANASHTHSISQINNLQTTLDSKQNKITNPCSFDGSNGSYVKLIRTGTTNYYVYIQHGNVTYQGSITQYPSVNVTFPQSFSGTPTVIVTFSPTSNSTGTYEALKVTNVTSTGFSVNTRMSANISAGYFRVNWIAIYTV